MLFESAINSLRLEGTCTISYRKKELRSRDDLRLYSHEWLPNQLTVKKSITFYLYIFYFGSQPAMLWYCSSLYAQGTPGISTRDLMGYQGLNPDLPQRKCSTYCTIFPASYKILHCLKCECSHACGYVCVARDGAQSLWHDVFYHWANIPGFCIVLLI